MSRTTALVPLVLLFGLSAALGCSYVSHYQPPRDLRARPVWDKHTVRVHLSEPPTPACDKAVTESVEGRALAIAPSYTYTPRHGRAAAVVFVPLVFWHPHPLLLPLALAGPSSFGDLARRFQAFAAMALVAMPIVAVALAASDPEDAQTSALAIDATNAYNDLARSLGTPCSID